MSAQCYSGITFTIIVCGGPYSTSTPGTQGSEGAPPRPAVPAPPVAPISAPTRSGGTGTEAQSPPTTVPGSISIGLMTWPFKVPRGTPCGKLITKGPALLLDLLQVALIVETRAIQLFTAPACPAAPVAARRAAPAAPSAPKAPAINPAVLAEQYWQRIPLPAPHPSVPPGWALCGKAAYLVTGGTTVPAATTNPTPLGPLTITPAGTYWVDWGDGGGWTGPYHGEGLPWPNGTISHTYDVAGTATITVRETWTATWRLGTAHGTLSGLTTRATIPALPIRQLQTVLTNN